MKELQERLASLSPKHRALLELRLGALLGGGGEETIRPYRGAATEFPLSFSQRRLWFIDQMAAAESSTYNLFYTLRLRGPIDLAALHGALAGVVERQEILSAVFVKSEDGPVQRLVPPQPLPLTIVDLQGVGDERREDAARALLAAVARRALPLDQWPMLRCLLLRLGEREHILALVVHHIIADGWSLIVLVRDFTALYFAALGAALALPALPIQYKDFALWQRDWLQGETQARQRAYWRQTLAGVPTFVDFPVDHPRPPSQSFASARYSFTLPAKAVRGVHRLALEEEGLTLFMVLLAAFQCLVRCYARQTDFVISSPISYRNRTELENLVGFFANTLLFRADLSGDPEFRQVLARVKKVVLGAYAHQDLPLEMVIAEVAPDRALSYPPLLQLSLNFMNQDLGGVATVGDLTRATETAEHAALSFEEFDFDHANANAELNLVVISQGGTMQGALHYRTSLFAPVTISAFLGQFEHLLGLVAERPEIRLGEIQEALASRDEERLSRERKKLQVAAASSLREMRRRAVASPHSWLRPGQ